jgi:hypothetical protein
MHAPSFRWRDQVRAALLHGAIALVLALLASAASAQAPTSVLVSWSPERPVQGTIFTLRIAAEVPLGSLTGTAAEEPLHFLGDESGGYFALAAVPIDTTGELIVPLRIERIDGGSETLELRIPVAPGAYRMEKLTVAPRFGQQPDAALAARIAAEAERAREVSRRSHETPRLWEGEFLRPRPGRITSGFGNGREFNGQVQSRHMGTDFAGAVGEPVHAAARGRVALVDSFYLGGNVVYLDHGAGLVTAYLHLSRAEVAPGEIVEAGQLIGRVGATGRVTGPHLHWIVRYGSITVDPLSLLQIAPTALAR